MGTDERLPVLSGVSKGRKRQVWQTPPQLTFGPD
jgi:hypothetical protein